MTRRRVGVLVSGAGTNLRSLLDAAAVATYPADIALVVSNRPSAAGLVIAAERGVETASLPIRDFDGDTVRRDAAIADRFRQAEVELVVCAGYDRVLGAPLLDAYPGAILNVHPSLLPAFAGGMHAVEDALAAGVRVTGCTVHLLEPGATDGGAIVLQSAVPVLDGDDPDSLRARIHVEEWRLLPRAVALWCEGGLGRDPGGRLTVAAPTPVISAVPVLAVRDLDEAVAHHRRLGFAVIARHDAQGRAVLRRDAVEIHLRVDATVDPALSTGGWYLRVADVDAVAAEWTAAGVSIDDGPEDRPWGWRELAVADPDGNLLRVGSPVPSIP